MTFFRPDLERRMGERYAPIAEMRDSQFNVPVCRGWGTETHAQEEPTFKDNREKFEPEPEIDPYDPLIDPPSKDMSLTGIARNAYSVLEPGPHIEPINNDLIMSRQEKHFELPNERYATQQVNPNNPLDPYGREERRFGRIADEPLETRALDLTHEYDTYQKPILPDLVTPEEPPFNPLTLVSPTLPPVWQKRSNYDDDLWEREKGDERLIGIREDNSHTHIGPDFVAMRAEDDPNTHLVWDLSLDRKVNRELPLELPPEPDPIIPFVPEPDPIPLLRLEDFPSLKPAFSEEPEPFDALNPYGLNLLKKKDDFLY